MREWAAQYEGHFDLGGPSNNMSNELPFSRFTTLWQVGVFRMDIVGAKEPLVRLARHGDVIYHTGFFEEGGISVAPNAFGSFGTGKSRTAARSATFHVNLWMRRRTCRCDECYDGGQPGVHMAKLFTC